MAKRKLKHLDKQPILTEEDLQRTGWNWGSIDDAKFEDPLYQNAWARGQDKSFSI